MAGLAFHSLSLRLIEGLRGYDVCDASMEPKTASKSHSHGDAGAEPGPVLGVLQHEPSADCLM